MSEYIFLIDCDNFFVSCERLFRPDLENKPVLVLSSNDGCVISRSQEVKDLGVGMGEPYFKIRDVCEKNKVSLFSTNFELYKDMSARVMSILRRFSNNIEVYSIDEAFLVFSFFDTTEDFLLEKAKEIRRTILQEVGVPVSVGIAKTKTLAKVATYFAKPKYKSGGCVALLDSQVISESLKKIEVRDVWGIGRRLAPKLAKAGIRTAYDFYEKSPAWVQAHTNILGVHTLLELQGSSQYGVFEDTALRKSLLHSQSFGRMLYNIADIETMVAYHARKVSETLRGEGALAREVSVFLYTVKQGGKRDKVFGTEVLETYNNSTLTIVKTALSILTRIYITKQSYSKAGVFVCNIVPEGALPKSTLFCESSNKDEVLMHTLDALQSKYGDVVRVGSELGLQAGKANAKYLSPRCTTRWSEVLDVRIHRSSFFVKK
jgi:DNA polymerase V